MMSSVVDVARMTVSPRRVASRHTDPQPSGLGRCIQVQRARLFCHDSPQVSALGACIKRVADAGSVNDGTFPHEVRMNTVARHRHHRHNFHPSPSKAYLYSKLCWLAILNVCERPLISHPESYINWIGCAVAKPCATVANHMASWLHSARLEELTAGTRDYAIISERISKAHPKPSGISSKTLLDELGSAGDFHPSTTKE